MEDNHNFRSDPHSDFVLDFVYGARRMKILVAAVNVGVFDDIEYLGKGQWVSDSAVAHYRAYDVDNTRRLLNTLAVLKLLDRGKTTHDSGPDRLYRNTISVTRYLLRASRNSLIPVLHTEETLMPLYLKNLPYVLKHGSVDHFPKLLWRGGYPQDDAFLTLPDFAVSARLEYNNRPWCHHAGLQPAIAPQQACSNVPLGATTLCAAQPKSMLQLGRELFMASWDSLQEQCLASLIGAFNLRGYKTIVDLGGGSGHLAWHITQAHPQVYITVYDTPRIIDTGDKPFCINQNIQYIKGDFFKDPLPDADCYILSHVLREYDDERVDILLGRIAEHLNQGGVLLIMEKVLQNDKRAPATCLMDDILLASLSRGRERSEDEYKKLLLRNGLAYHHIKRVVGVNTFDVMIVRKPSEPIRKLPLQQDRIL